MLYVLDAKMGRHGLSAVCHQQLLALSSLGIRVDLVSRSPSGLPGVSFRGMRWTPANAASFLPSRFYYPLQMRFFGWLGARAVAARNYSAVIAWRGRALLPFRAAADLGVPCYLNEPRHHYAASDSSRSLGAWPMLSPTEIEQEYQLAHRILAPSDLSARTFIVRGYARDKVTCIGRGVDVDAFRPSARACDARPFRMIFCGRACERKGIREVVRAWLDAQLSECELLVVGAIDDKVSDLVDATRGTSIRWLGFRTDVASLMRDCDAQILMSSAEGMAKSLLEGASAGLASIFTAHTGTPLQDGHHGFEVDRADVQGVVQRIRLLAQDRSRCRQMGLASRELVLREYSWEAFRSRFIGALDNRFPSAKLSE